MYWFIREIVMVWTYLSFIYLVFERLRDWVWIFERLVLVLAYFFGNCIGLELLFVHLLIVSVCNRLLQIFVVWVEFLNFWSFIQSRTT